MSRNPPNEIVVNQPSEGRNEEVRKAVEQALHERAATDASGADKRLLRALRRRIVADLVSLYAICPRRACRRARRCRFASAPCVAERRQTAMARLTVLLGDRAPETAAGGEDEI